MKKEHPCFTKGSSAARLHIPIAPGCNIQCNYCNRKVDCPNESRPGVSSKILSPKQAEYYVDKMVEEVENLTVIGIAGPGDAFNKPEKTMDTLRRIRKKHPDLLFCISSNGLNVEPYLHELKDIGLSHLTITVNGIDPNITKDIYSWVLYKKRRYMGLEAAKLLLEKQKEVVLKACSLGILVKINTLYLPGINDFHLEEIAKTVSEWGAEMMNILPVIPVEGTKFEHLVEPGHKEVNEARKLTGKYIKQMTHCGRCRADAAGRISDNKYENIVIEKLKEAVDKDLSLYNSGDRIAIASREGVLVNMHLGEAGKFYIFEITDRGPEYKECRTLPLAGSGDLRWETVCETIKGCKTLLVNGIGDKPSKIIKEYGIGVDVCEGLISIILDSAYNNRGYERFKVQKSFKCGSSCSGSASGCL